MRFGDVASIANGQVSPTASEFRALPHIGPENIESHSGRIIGVESAEEIGLISGKYLFDAEAIVYSKIRPYLNKACVPGFKGLCSADAYPVWPKQDLISKEYLLYSMLSPQFVRQTIAVSMRTGMPKINRGDLNGLKVELPGLPEQRRIVAVLSTWDRGIEEAERLLALKERRKRALMQQLLTGKRRFPEFVRSKATRETRFGPRPVDWPYPQIEEFAVEGGERNGEGDEIPVLSCTKHAGLVPSLEYFGKRVFSEDTSPYKVVRRNQFAYATNHIEEGSIGLLDFVDAGLVSPMYTVFAVSDAVDTRFLYALFKTELYRHIFEVYTSSSVDRRGSLRWNEFKKIHVALPTIDEQCRIAAVLNACNDELGHLRAQVAALKQQKRGLMQKLLTGQVRVPMTSTSAKVNS